MNRLNARFRYLMMLLLAVGIGLGPPAARAAPERAAAPARPGAGIPLVAPATVDVQILDFQFVPAEITVSAGTTVRWSNLGAFAHTATSVSPAGLFDSGTLLTGQSFEFQFTTPGVYTYRCSIHPSMTGKITVVRRLYLPLILR